MDVHKGPYPDQWVFFQCFKEALSLKGFTDSLCEWQKDKELCDGISSLVN